MPGIVGAPTPRRIEVPDVRAAGAAAPPHADARLVPAGTMAPAAGAAATMSGADVYDVGDVYPTSVQVRDADGRPPTPPPWCARPSHPTGTTTTPPIEHTGPGAHAAGIPITMPGLWSVDWNATGLNASAYPTRSPHATRRPCPSCPSQMRRPTSTSHRPTPMMSCAPTSTW